MKLFAILMTLISFSAHSAGELILDCHFGRTIKSFSLKNIDQADGTCRTGNYLVNEGPIQIKYEIELCGMEASGTTFYRSAANLPWDYAYSFSTKNECLLRRKIVSNIPGCSLSRSRC